MEDLSDTLIMKTRTWLVEYLGPDEAWISLMVCCLLVVFYGMLLVLSAQDSSSVKGTRWSSLLTYREASASWVPC